MYQTSLTIPYPTYINIVKFVVYVEYEQNVFLTLELNAFH